MELAQAMSRLVQLRAGGDLAEVSALVDEARPALRITAPEAAVEFMLSVCDALESYDFGDYARQPLLLHRYAQETLDEPGLLLRQQLRLLGHLEEDLPSQDPNWPQLRDDRARLWLELLRQVRELAGSEPDPDEAPSFSVPVPDGVDQLLGVAPEAITDDQARANYEQAIARNAQSLERFRRYHEMQRLLQQYQARALRYLTRAFAEPPHDRKAMRQLLTDFDLSVAGPDQPNSA